MKNFINVLVVLALVGLAIVFVYTTEDTNLKHSRYGLGLRIVIIFMFLWGCKLIKDY
jgi:hypothetical protein